MEADHAHSLEAISLVEVKRGVLQSDVPGEGCELWHTRMVARSSTKKLRYVMCQWQCCHLLY